MVLKIFSVSLLWLIKQTILQTLQFFSQPPMQFEAQDTAEKRGDRSRRNCEEWKTLSKPESLKTVRIL